VTHLAGGLAVAGAAVVLVAAAVGPDLMVRQVVLFQLVRPADGLATLPERALALAGPAGLLFALLGAVVGLVVAWRTGRLWQTTAWVPVLVWVLLGLMGFLLSRSFYQHYSSQLVPGLALLAGGAGAALSRPRLAHARSRLVLIVVMVVLSISAVAGLAPAVSPRPDPIFATVARYMADAVPPGGTVLTTDAQFNLLASRALPRASSGYLVDSYGQLVYAGLGLASGSLWDALARVWQGRGSASVHDLMWRPAAQSLLRDHLARSDLVVVHAVGRGRITAETVAWLNQEFQLVETTRRYDIYRRVR
jgi:hypothetical protein